MVHAGSAPALEHYLAEAYAPAIAELAQALRRDFVGAAATAMGKDLMPRVAARLDAAMASEVLGFDGQRRGRHLHPPDVGGQRHRRGEAGHPGEGVHRAPHRVHAPPEKGGARAR